MPNGPATPPGPAAAPDPSAGPPRWAPSAAEYDDLALALDGIFADVTVVAPDSGGRPAGEVELTDPEGTPVATLRVTRRLESAAGRWMLTGPVTPLAPREDGVFRHLHKTPAEVDAIAGGRQVAAVTVDAPLDEASLSALRTALQAYDPAAMVVLLPLVGAGTPRVVGAHALVRATIAAAGQLPGDPLVVPVPLARREDATDDAARRTAVANAYGEPIQTDLAGMGPDSAYPDRVAAVVAAANPPRDVRGLVVFFTGLSGSGKSTLARRLRDVLLEEGDRSVTLLDGDVVRRLLSAGLGFSRTDREANITRIGFVAAEVARHGGVAICAPIAPYAATRTEVRRMVLAAGGDFVLVHVSTPLAECERRDRKGLYAKARAGLIPEFTGISDPYEAPNDADVAVDTSDLGIDEATTKVLDLLRGGGWLRPA
jgi:sulfate adenylyltransferase